MFKFSLLYFLIAFSVGIFACYVMTPSPKLVVKFPSPQNVGGIIYKDNSKNCFTFKADKVSCNKDTINQPIFLQNDD